MDKETSAKIAFQLKLLTNWTIGDKCLLAIGIFSPICKFSFLKMLKVKSYLEIFNDCFVAEDLKLFDDDGLDLSDVTGRKRVDRFDDSTTSGS